MALHDMTPVNPTCLTTWNYTRSASIDSTPCPADTRTCLYGPAQRIPDQACYTT